MELIFQKPDIKDSDRLREVLKHNIYRGCELSTSNIILWSEYYHIEFSIVEHTLVLKHTDDKGTIRLSFPIGAGTEEQERRIFDLELEFFAEIGQAPWFGMIDPWMYEKINRWYPERFEINYERDWSDYIYSREKLSTLAGKKLHGKRNHIKRFMDNHPDWGYESIKDENVDACIAMAKDWCRANCVKEDDEKEEEAHLVIKALRNHKQLHMKGGVLKAEGRVIAFTLGCQVTKDTFDVSFEKAYSEIQGAYPMINQQFVLHELQEYTYINREEDVGVEGLRKAKLSYYPEFLLEKGVIREKKCI